MTLELHKSESALGYQSSDASGLSLDDLIAAKREVRIAYVQRIRVPHIKYRRLIEEIDSVRSLSGKVPRPGSLLIHGPSRSGKTTIAEHFTETYFPQRKASGTDHIPVLSITAPPTPTKNALAQQLLCALGDPQWHRGTLAQMTKRILMLLTGCGVELVFLDEMQNLVDMTGAATEVGLTAFLHNLVDESRIPFVVLGLDSCVEMFIGNQMLRARFKSCLPITQYDFDDADDRKDWINFLEAFAYKLPLRRLPDFTNKKLARKMWYASLGLVGHVANMLAEAVDLVVRQTTTQDTLDIEILSEAFQRTAWQEATYLVNPFEEDVEGASLPEIKIGYADYIAERGKKKRDATALKVSMKKLRI